MEEITDKVEEQRKDDIDKCLDWLFENIKDEKNNKIVLELVNLEEKGSSNLKANLERILKENN
eukprot:CAMPEP_0170563266 /NCGR_PEP_ID=MMETSP0211-20121228/65461_1 /TAXON_ID=311385 /ORGANISM="Pseudokeronopsis sp., Strain OXSARD2" /LENGTH=62 /DNA_ID=CAMNT_0010881285 /DNA_START=91 /DNA_END=279 /DNA_ORIENTATION=+